MEINRCNRCGNFYVSNGPVCPNCTIKDNAEFIKFKNYMESNEEQSSLDEISLATGISQTNLTRFLGYDNGTLESSDHSTN